MALATFNVENGIAEITVGPTLATAGTCTLPSDLLAIFDSFRESSPVVVMLRLEDSGMPAGSTHEGPHPAPAALNAYLSNFQRAIGELEAMTVPTLAVVPADCAGGAFQLALACDLIIAARTSQFSFPETALGFPSLHAGLAQLADCIGHCRAIESAFFGVGYDAEELEQLNIVSRVVDDDRLTQESHALASRLSAGPTRAYASAKAMLRTWRTGGVSAARAAVPDLARTFFTAPEKDKATA